MAKRFSVGPGIYRAKDKEGQMLLTASYDNTKQYTVGRLAKEFGSELAKRLK